MRNTWMVVLILSAVALAGCVDGGDSEITDSRFDVPGCSVGTRDEFGVHLIGPLDQDYYPPLTEDRRIDLGEYDVWDFNLTNYRTCTLPKVGHSDLREGDPHNYLGEMDMRGDLDIGVIAAVGSGEAPTVYILDISTRDDPQVLSSIVQDDTYITDVKISDDGDFLFTASQTTPASVCVPDSDDPANGCIPGPKTGYIQEDGATAPQGFTIYDISDRSAPTYLQTVANPDERGCHMLSHEIIDETDVVFCAGGYVQAYGFERTTDGTPWVELGRFTYQLPDGSGTTSASPTGCVDDDSWVDFARANANSASSGGTTDAFTAAYGPLCEAPHDMTVVRDEVDGRILMNVAHWNEGVRVVDASAPVDDGFVTLARWTGQGATHYGADVHAAASFWVGDTRYVVATPEVRSAEGFVPSIWVLDATDLGDGTEIKELELVAEWFHPMEVPSPYLLTTTHQWQVAPTGPDVAIEDVNIYITMNHFGVWVLDFEHILAGDNEGAISGFHMSRAPLDKETDVGNAPLSTWDVNVVDGYIYGSDRATGLWVFDYTGDEPNDPRLTGFA